MKRRRWPTIVGALLLVLTYLVGRAFERAAARTAARRSPAPPRIEFVPLFAQNAALKKWLVGVIVDGQTPVPIAPVAWLTELEVQMACDRFNQELAR